MDISQNRVEYNNLITILNSDNEDDVSLGLGILEHQRFNKKNRKKFKQALLKRNWRNTADRDLLCYKKSKIYFTENGILILER